MNTKKKGAVLERELVNWARARGAWAMRAPASLGIDVVVIFHGHVFFCECTTERCVRAWKLQRLLEASSSAGAAPAWCTRKKGRKGFTVTYPQVQSGLKKERPAGL